MKVHCHKTKNDHPDYGMVTRSAGSVVTSQSHATSPYLRREDAITCSFSPPNMIPKSNAHVNASAKEVIMAQAWCSTERGNHINLAEEKEVRL